jgi:enamine deaminase RidA (YjgF/YER057c/UK114 family)
MAAHDLWLDLKRRTLKPGMLLSFQPTHRINSRIWGRVDKGWSASTLEAQSSSAIWSDHMRENISSSYPFEDTYGYSRAVRVGQQVFVSGTTARQPQLNGDAYEQACAALSIISDALARTGAHLRDVVRTVVYVRSLEDVHLIARAHSEVFGHIRPASTVVQVAGLTPTQALVELEVTAVIVE